MCKIKRTAWYCLSWLFLCCGLLPAQTSDDFSDGDITSNPAWSGDLSHFQVNNGKILQLHAPAAGNSALFVPVDVPDSARWRIDVQLGFAPSAANRLRLYLWIDTTILPIANGYFLEIGENGSEDALKLFRQDAGIAHLLASGTQGLVAADTQAFSLDIRRSRLGEWLVDFKPSGGLSFPSEIAVTDTTHAPGNNLYFALWCAYTATRTEKFHFDNLRIEEDLPDLLPPVLQSVVVEGTQQLLLTFDEPIAAVSGNETSHYHLLPMGKVPVEANLQSDSRSVLLTFDEAFPTGSHTIRSEGLSDLAGNLAGIQSLNFDHIAIEKASEFDVLINEIMADPAPSAGLPEVEWVELYNRSDKYLELSDLRIDGGSSPQPLPGLVLAPGSYTVLASPQNASALSLAGFPSVAVQGMPSLNNDSDLVSLVSADGSVIDHVQYNVSWHDDEAKKEGGWSLELVNPGSPCLGASNWRSCPLPIGGGTPGAANAALGNLPDTLAPKPESVEVNSVNELTIRFSEGLDQTAAFDVNLYRLEPQIEISSASFAPDDRASLKLVLDEGLQTGVVYLLVVEPGVSDCAGNASQQPDTLLLGVPEEPEAGDLVFNEILFNPPSGGADFVELYNRSNKVLICDGFYLDNTLDANGPIAIAGERLIMPGSLVTFTMDRDFLMANHQNVNPFLLLQHALPSLPDDIGNITLFWSDGTENVLVDAFDYQEDYHNALLGSSDREGVSLERLNVDQPTSLASNWTSAAQQTFGLPGTPTQPNSQSSGPIAQTNELVVLPYNRLSPDGDGREDFLEIRYQTPSAGYAATLIVYDSWGIPVRSLLRQTLTGVQGFLRWDGDDDSGTVVRPGVYVLFLEVFSPAGDIQRVKKTVAVVAKF